MATHIQKWGNSLAVRIPMQFAKRLHLHRGSPVILQVEGGRLIMQPPQYNLDAMVDQITAKNRHGPLLEDQQAGNEEW